MYIQLTERCNMRCKHCCMSATAKGRDMEWGTFIQAIALCENFDSYVTLGGGEPTLWKHFGEAMDWLKDMLPAYDHINEVLVITNGTRVRNSMKAIRLMELFDDCYDNQFNIIMSDPYDGFHDPCKVHPSVYEYFWNKQKRKALYGVGESLRKVNRLLRAGRARQLTEYDFQNDECPCSDLFIRPNGDIHMCGCPDSPSVGQVDYRYLDLPDNYEWHECYKNQEEEEEDDGDELAETA